MENERPKTGEIDVFIRWEGVRESQLKEIRQTVVKHPQFKRLMRLSGSLTELPSSIEVYEDDKKNYIGFLYPGTHGGKIHVISSPNSAPIVEPILGKENSFITTF